LELKIPPKYKVGYSVKREVNGALLRNVIRQRGRGKKRNKRNQDFKRCAYILYSSNPMRYIHTDIVSPVSIALETRLDYSVNEP